MLIVNDSLGRLDYARLVGRYLKGCFRLNVEGLFVTEIPTRSSLQPETQLRGLHGTVGEFQQLDPEDQTPRLNLHETLTSRVAKQSDVSGGGCSWSYRQI